MAKSSGNHTQIMQIMPKSYLKRNNHIKVIKISQAKYIFDNQRGGATFRRPPFGFLFHVDFMLFKWFLYDYYVLGMILACFA